MIYLSESSSRMGLTCGHLVDLLNPIKSMELNPNASRSTSTARQATLIDVGSTSFSLVVLCRLVFSINTSRLVMKMLIIAGTLKNIFSKI